MQTPTTIPLAISCNCSDFFTWLDGRAATLVSPCHWLAFSPQLELSKEVEAPTFGQLEFLIQLVRVQRPMWLDFTRQLITESVLAQAALNASVASAKLHTESSTSHLGVAL